MHGSFDSSQCLCSRCRCQLTRDMRQSVPREALRIVIGRTYDEYLESRVPVLFENSVQEPLSCVVWYCSTCAHILSSSIHQEREYLCRKVDRLTTDRDVIEQGGSTVRDPFVHAIVINSEIDRCKALIFALSLLSDQFSRERAEAEVS